jgi:hypothetical protein
MPQSKMRQLAQLDSIKRRRCSGSCLRISSIFLCVRLAIVPSVLSVFPNAKKAMEDGFSKELFRGMWGACPLLKEIRVRPQTEGKEASYQREDGKIVEMNYQLRRVEVRQYRMPHSRLIHAANGPTRCRR